MLCCMSKKVVAGADLGPPYDQCPKLAKIVMHDSIESEPSPEDDVSSILLPCATCARTFMPQSLEKHVKICERAAAKKRKPFDSAKQRIQGTDLAEFLPKQGKRQRHYHEDRSSASRSSWKESHDDFIRAIRAARNEIDDTIVSTQAVKSTMSSGAPTRANEKGICPTCSRQFGIKAYDRHVAWCKERSTRVPISQTRNIAKERLVARMKYRAPTLKNRRQTNREKYSPGLTSAPSVSNKTSSTPSTVKPKESLSANNYSKRIDSSVKQKPSVGKCSGQGNSSAGPMMKTRLRDDTNRQMDVRHSVLPPLQPPQFPSPVNRIINFRSPVLKCKKHYIAGSALLKNIEPQTTNNIYFTKSKRELQLRSDYQTKMWKNRNQQTNITQSETVRIVPPKNESKPKVNNFAVNEKIIDMVIQPCKIDKKDNRFIRKQISRGTRGVQKDIVRQKQNDKIHKENVTTEALGVCFANNTTTIKSTRDKIKLAPIKNNLACRNNGLVLYDECYNITSHSNIGILRDTYFMKESISNVTNTVGTLRKKKCIPMNYIRELQSCVKSRKTNCKYNDVHANSTDLTKFHTTINWGNFSPAINPLKRKQSNHNYISNVEVAYKRKTVDQKVDSLSMNNLESLWECLKMQHKMKVKRLLLLYQESLFKCFKNANVMIIGEKENLSLHKQCLFHKVQLTNKKCTQFNLITLTNHESKQKSVRNVTNCNAAKGTVFRIEGNILTTSNARNKSSLAKDFGLLNFNCTCTCYKTSFTEEFDKRFQTLGKSIHCECSEKWVLEKQSRCTNYKLNLINPGTNGNPVNNECMNIVGSYHNDERKNTRKIINSSEIGIIFMCYLDDQFFNDSLLQKRRKIRHENWNSADQALVNIEYTQLLHTHRYQQRHIKNHFNVTDLFMKSWNFQELVIKSSVTHYPPNNHRQKLSTLNSEQTVEANYFLNRSGSSVNNYNVDHSNCGKYDNEDTQKYKSILKSTRAAITSTGKDTSFPSKHQKMKAIDNKNIAVNSGIAKIVGIESILNFHRYITFLMYIQEYQKRIVRHYCIDMLENVIIENPLRKTDYFIKRKLKHVRDKQNCQKSHGPSEKHKLTVKDYVTFRSCISKVPLESANKPDIIIGNEQSWIRNKYANEITKSNNGMSLYEKSSKTFGKDEIFMDQEQEAGNKILSKSNVQVKMHISYLSAYKSRKAILSGKKIGKADKITAELNSSTATRRKFYESMHLLRDSTDTLISSVEAVDGDSRKRRPHVMSTYQKKTVEQIVVPISNPSIKLTTLPKIRNDLWLEKHHECRSKVPKDSCYWQEASECLHNRHFYLDAPYCRANNCPKRNLKRLILPPIPRCNNTTKSGPCKDYDPFLLAEQQMNDLLSDASESTTGDPNFHNSQQTLLPLSHSSAFVKYPYEESVTTVIPITTSKTITGSQAVKDKRASLIAPPMEFEDVTSDFSSDSTETNSLSREIFLQDFKDLNDLRNCEKSLEQTSERSVKELGRRMIINKSKALGGEIAENQWELGNKKFVGSTEKTRNILHKILPKVVRPTAMNRSNSVRAASAPKPFPDRKTSSSVISEATKNIGPKRKVVAQKCSNTNLINQNNNYVSRSGSNLSLSSMASSEIDMKRGNSLFDDMISSFDDNVGSFPAFRFLVKNDSPTLSSPVHSSSEMQDGQHSDEEVSSPDDYKRQERGKFSADSAYSSLNRNCSNHGRSTNDVNGRFEDDATKGNRHRASAANSSTTITTVPTTVASDNCKMSNFCHECGSRFPKTAKFCCECGMKRLFL